MLPKNFLELCTFCFCPDFSAFYFFNQVAMLVTEINAPVFVSGALSFQAITSLTNFLYISKSQPQITELYFILTSAK